MDPKSEADELEHAIQDLTDRTSHWGRDVARDDVLEAARAHLSALRAQPVTREAIAATAERAFVDADPLDAWSAVADAVLRLLQASAPAPNPNPNPNPDESAALALLRRLGQGGSIVTTAGMTETQVAIARAADRLLVTSDGCGYVFVPGPVEQASAPAVLDLESEAAQEAIEKQARAMFELWKIESIEVRDALIAVRRDSGPFRYDGGGQRATVGGSVEDFLAEEHASAKPQPGDVIGHARIVYGGKVEPREVPFDDEGERPSAEVPASFVPFCAYESGNERCSALTVPGRRFCARHRRELNPEAQAERPFSAPQDETVNWIDSWHALRAETWRLGTRGDEAEEKVARLESALKARDERIASLLRTLHRIETIECDAAGEAMAARLYDAKLAGGKGGDG